jgi:trimeric autotransporter adhesin
MMELGSLIRAKVRFATSLARNKRRGRCRSTIRGLEILESRDLLATFTVMNLQNAGTGSFREAIIEANKQPGADTIEFDVAGTIRISGTSLPAITDSVTIDGTSAPGFNGSPVVTINFQGTKGLNFAKGADGSTLSALSLIRAGNAGVTLSASNVTLERNDIGLLSNGTTVAGNRGDGVRINASSHGDLIGGSDPVSSVDYYTTQDVYTSNGTSMPVSGWQGVRASGTSGQYLIAGTSGSNGLLYDGPISGVGGTAYSVNYPGAETTSVYGPDLLSNGQLRLVGSYTTGNGLTQGFLFQGPVDDLSNSSDYQTIDDPNDTYTYIHSTMGDLAVGNGGDAPGQTDNAFIYSVSQDKILTDILYPGSTGTSAYGIWYNGGTSYTICGGYTALLQPGEAPFGGYLVDYDSSTGLFTHWTSFSDPNGQIGQSLATHFQGISSTEAGVYTLGANSVQPGSDTVLVASVASVRRNPDGTFGPAVWTNLSDPNLQGLLTANAVEGNQVVGIGFTNSGVVSYQATINTGFQLSNVMSGNGGNGIGIYGASGDTIAMNNIGTDASGTLRRGNAKNGILVTNGASANLIGGQATGGNDPTAGVIVRPPQGNLISGNRGNGVLITGGATQTTLSGNFVGTTATGDTALGNRRDGVAIVKANGNQLIGCTFQQSPFVFYNVLSGNGGNGLRITNSNNTTVQANFMGAGADNTTVVANGGDGLLASGTSQNTQVGGPIPLGNVISGNNKNGIEETGRAGGLVSFNTFAGSFAFGGIASNQGDGILITSSGGNNLIRTCLITGNGRNGIELGGNAQGVQVTDTTVGLEVTENGILEIPNLGDGIEIDGRAHDNEIGGFQPSVEPQVTISDNDGYGIAIVGSARNNLVVHTDIGTTYQGVGDLGNGLGGIYLGPGSSATTIGGSSAPLQNIIDDSGGPGVLIRSSDDNKVRGNEITSNGGDGVTIISSRDVTIGGSGSGAGNQIVDNQGYGLEATGGCSGTLVQSNGFAANAEGNVDLTKSRGITYIP